MKKFLLPLLLILTTNLLSQPKVSDSVKISKPALQRILTAAKQTRELEAQIVTLTNRIDLLQGNITEYQKRDTATVNTYERQIAADKQSRALLEAQVNTFEKMIRKQRFKTKVTGFMGILTTGIAIYFATKN